MATMTAHNGKTQAFPKPPWFKSFFKKFRESVPAANPLERRNAYRLRVLGMGSESMFVIVDDKFGAYIHDLSADGFSCEFQGKSGFRVGQRIRIELTLPLDEPITIQTEALLVSQRKNEDAPLVIQGFEFSPDMDEESRDLIHQFIIRKQLELIRGAGISRLAAMS